MAGKVTLGPDTDSVVQAQWPRKGSGYHTIYSYITTDYLYN